MMFSRVHSHLSYFRADRKLSQSALATLLGVHVATISAVESGKYSVSAKLAERFATAFPGWRINRADDSIEFNSTAR